MLCNCRHHTQTSLHGWANNLYSSKGSSLHTGNQSWESPIPTQWTNTCQKKKKIVQSLQTLNTQYQFGQVAICYYLTASVLVLLHIVWLFQHCYMSQHVTNILALVVFVLWLSTLPYALLEKGGFYRKQSTKQTLRLHWEILREFPGHWEAGPNLSDRTVTQKPSGDSATTSRACRLTHTIQNRPAQPDNKLFDLTSYDISSLDGGMGASKLTLFLTLSPSLSDWS